MRLDIIPRQKSTVAERFQRAMIAGALVIGMLSIFLSGTAILRSKYTPAQQGCLDFGDSALYVVLSFPDTVTARLSLPYTRENYGEVEKVLRHCKGKEVQIYMKVKP